MDACVARFERANDLLLEQAYQKLALGRCRNVLHILGERCGDPQDMYHWGLPAPKRNPDGSCTICGDYLARMKRIVSPTYLEDIATRR